MFVDGMPTISVSRALAHYYERMDFDLEAIRDFYNLVSAKNKPPLETCHIYFSPLVLDLCDEDESMEMGAVRTNKDWSDIDPYAPYADIIIFCGSLELLDCSEEISITVGHELVHFAHTMQAMKKKRALRSFRRRANRWSLLIADLGLTTFLWSVVGSALQMRHLWQLPLLYVLVFSFAAKRANESTTPEDDSAKEEGLANELEGMIAKEAACFRLRQDRQVFPRRRRHQSLEMDAVEIVRYHQLAITAPQYDT